MILYRLACDQEHQFESWFQSAAAFETLSGQGRLSCAVCGSAKVAKALMAPSVATKAEAPASRPDVRTEVEAAIAALRREIEESSEYVGLDFAAEARAIHEGDAPARSIYGEAHKEDARRLVEDGVPVAPLPFLPTRRAN